MDPLQRVLRENSESTVALLKLHAKRTLRVDRSEFISPAKVEGTDSAPVCAYRVHPGMPEEVLSRLTFRRFFRPRLSIFQAEA